MSTFPNSQNTVINGGSFISTHSIQINTGSDLEEERYAIQTLEQNVTSGAFHNSKDRYNAPKCHPRTREAVFREISEWIHVTSREKPILWLYGPAGAGKSAIAQSVAEKANEMNYLLVGTYFFNRSDDQRNNATHLIPSLAYQMIQSVPRTRRHALDTIIWEPGVFSLNFKTQMGKLILQPLIAAGVVRQRPDDATSFPMLIIIDGLDECQKSEERTAFLEALIDSCQDPRIPLIFLCHSRPECDIRAAFNDSQTSDLSARLVLDDKFDPDSDIETFLIHHFAEIKKKHILKEQIPHDWPSREIIEELVRKSSGQFIYASTAMKHITSRRHNPMKRLDTVLSVGNRSDTSPFKELDALYHIVLSCIEEDDRSTVRRIIGMICFSPRRTLWPPVKHTSVGPLDVPIAPATMDQVLNLEPGTTLLLIDDLHSLLEAHGPNDHLRPFHASLCDFLCDRSRSGIFYVDPGLPLADHLLVYFNLLLNASILPTTVHLLTIYPLSRDYFSEASLTMELLEFFEIFSWEHVLREYVPAGSLWAFSTLFNPLPLPLWIRHICELYTFCKMASKRSLEWAGVYQRALRELVAWVDSEMALPSPLSNYRGSRKSFAARSGVLQRYIAAVLDFSDDLKHPNSDFLDIVFDVLQIPGLSCIHHISPKRHNALILETILKAFVLDRFPHAELLSQSSCSFSATGGSRCCQRCRVDITILIDLSSRTSYLDVLLPYIETEVCRPDWVPGEDQGNCVEEFQAAISRYKKKPVPDYYNDSGWDVDIPSLQAAAAGIWLPLEFAALSDVLPICFDIFE